MTLAMRDSGIVVLDQKWPSEVIVLRHGLTTHNVRSQEKREDSFYNSFKAQFEKSPHSRVTLAMSRKVVSRWPTNESDRSTQIVQEAIQNAVATGVGLSKTHELPDVIYISNYARTRQTLDAVMSGWPELRGVKVVVDDRIREQEHGLCLLVGDWRVFFARNPEQYALRKLEGRFDYRWPQGESVYDVKERLRSFQGTLSREHAGQRVLLVTHHLTILALRMNLERFDEEEFLRLDEEEKPLNCSVTVYASVPGGGKSGKGKLELQDYNVCHYN
ncbi:MAG: histidine phosphatase family protein [Candidatus Levybacteria bacterium]|nr:histidine phosphatase family protein [Candidatus Levybacteria bacterium]